MGGTMTIIQMAVILFIFQQALKVPLKPARNPRSSVEQKTKGK